MSVVPVCGLSDSSADIYAYPSIVNPGDEITVTYSGAPGFELDWIAMYKVGDPNEEEYDMGYYLAGEKSGTLIFTAPDEPGDYEFRLFEDDGYTDIARSNIVTVQEGTTPTSEEAIILFEANFDDGYAPGFGNEVGDWEVHLLYPYTGMYTATTGTYKFSMAGDTNWQDYVIDADFFNAQDGGLLVRAQDQDNCIALIVRPSYNDIYWYVRKGGMWADYKGQVTLGHEPGEELQVKVEVVGSEFKAYINGVLKTTLENTEFPKGKIGLYLYYQPDQYWDNVVVYSSGAAGPAPTPTTPTEGGLVGYWNFNEGSGNLAYDRSGSGNDGTIHGATWVDNGSCEKALSFDGVDDYVETNPATFQSNDITVEAWIYPKSFSSYNEILRKGDRIGNNLLFTFDLISNKISFYIYSNGSQWDSIFGTTSLELNKWYHVVGVYRSSDKFFAVYVNGTEDNSKTSTLSSLYHDAYKYWISPRYDRQFVDSICFNGIIDEVRIYDRALSEEEIQADMNECAPKSTLPDLSGKSDCEGAGGYWYNNQCNEEEEESGYGDLKVTYISREEVQEKYTVSYDETFKYDDDGDGANEATLYYKGENNLVMSSDDTDKDGKVDLIFHYDDEEFLMRAIRDTDGGGELDQILHFNREEEIIKVEKIRNE